MGLFGGGGLNPISAISGMLGGGGGGGSSSMYSGGIGSSSGNTNASTSTTNTATNNEDRRLVIGEGAIGINSESSPVTMNFYGGTGTGDATAGAGTYTNTLNGTTPGGSLADQATGTDWAAWFEDNKVLIMGGVAALLVAGAFFIKGGK